MQSCVYSAVGYWHNPYKHVIEKLVLVADAGKGPSIDSRLAFV